MMFHTIINNNNPVTELNVDLMWRDISALKALTAVIKSVYTFTEISYGITTGGQPVRLPLIFFDSSKNPADLVASGPFRKIIFLDKGQRNVSLDMRLPTPNYTGILHPVCEIVENHPKFQIAKIITPPDMPILTRDFYRTVFLPDGRIHTIIGIKHIREHERTQHNYRDLKRSKDYVDMVLSAMGLKYGRSDEMAKTIQEFVATHLVGVTKNPFRAPPAGPPDHISRRMFNADDIEGSTARPFIEGEPFRRNNPAPASLNPFSLNPADDPAFLNREVERLRRLNQQLASDCDQRKSTVWSLSSQVDTLKNELVAALEEVANLQNQPAAKTSSINVWDIIGCKPNDEKERIRKAIISSLNLYHPDRVASGGELLVKYANEITQEILKFKKQMTIK